MRQQPRQSKHKGRVTAWKAGWFSIRAREARDTFQPFDAESRQERHDKKPPEQAFLAAFVSLPKQQDNSEGDKALVESVAAKISGKLRCPAMPKWMCTGDREEQSCAKGPKGAKAILCQLGHPISVDELAVVDKLQALHPPCLRRHEMLVVSLNLASSIVCSFLG